MWVRLCPKGKLEQKWVGGKFSWQEGKFARKWTQTNRGGHRSWQPRRTGWRGGHSVPCALQGFVEEVGPLGVLRRKGATKLPDVHLGSRVALSVQGISSFAMVCELSQLAVWGVFSRKFWGSRHASRLVDVLMLFKPPKKSTSSTSFVCLFFCVGLVKHQFYLIVC